MNHSYNFSYNCSNIENKLKDLFDYSERISKS